MICFVIRMRFYLSGFWFGFPPFLFLWTPHPRYAQVYRVITRSSVQNLTEKLLAPQTDRR